MAGTTVPEAEDPSAEPPGVLLTADCTERSVAVAAAVAAGVADALDLGLEPAASLTAIAVEGSRNVLRHAYPRGVVGPIWMSFATEDGSGGDSESVRVHVRDAGRGCSLWPTGADPPGVGMSLICELSESMDVTSRRARGTAIAASVSTAEPNPSDPPIERGPRLGATELSFADPRLLSPVLPRALAALIESPETTVDEITGISRLADAIAGDLEAVPGVHRVRVPDPDEAGSLTIEARPDGRDGVRYPFPPTNGID